MTVRTFVIILSLVAAYFGFTWFNFGSSHPCEILLARQKDHHVQIAEERHRRDLQTLEDVAREKLPAKAYERFVSNLEEYSSTLSREEDLRRSVVKALREKFSKMTPAECAWQAITESGGLNP